MQELPATTAQYRRYRAWWLCVWCVDCVVYLMLCMQQLCVITGSSKHSVHFGVWVGQNAAVFKESDSAWTATVNLAVSCITDNEGSTDQHKQVVESERYHISVFHHSSITKHSLLETQPKAAFTLTLVPVGVWVKLVRLELRKWWCLLWMVMMN